MALRNVAMNIEHVRFEKDVRKLLEKYSGKMSSTEQLAAVSRMAGMIVGLQDVRYVTQADALEIVRTNMEKGNMAVIKKLQNAEKETSKTVN